MNNFIVTAKITNIVYYEVSANNEDEAKKLIIKLQNPLSNGFDEDLAKTLLNEMENGGAGPIVEIVSTEKI